MITYEHVLIWACWREGKTQTKTMTQTHDRQNPGDLGVPGEPHRGEVLKESKESWETTTARRLGQATRAKTGPGRPGERGEKGEKGEANMRNLALNVATKPSPPGALGSPGDPIRNLNLQIYHWKM